VKVDARPTGLLEIRNNPNSTKEILGYVPDNAVVQIYGETTIGSGRNAYRKILRFDPDSGKYIIGYVKNIKLLDNCTGSDPFGCLPVPYNAWYQTYGFGPNGYAELVCAHGKSDCPYRKLRGLHNGLDFSVPATTPLIWAGTQEAIYDGSPLDAQPNIAFTYMGYTVIYGHRLANYLNNERQGVYRVRPGQTIGESGDPGNSSHLHLGVRTKDTSVFINPQYLFSPLLRATISTHNMGSYPLGLSSMSMYSFDRIGPWFWDDPCDWTGITWGTKERYLYAKNN
jgi:hypothetical protein